MAKSTGPYPSARGESEATGIDATSEGQGTVASGNFSHAEGAITTASGDFSHAEGQATAAIGDDSHAEGQETTASGDGSHAEGVNSIAPRISQHSKASGELTEPGDAQYGNIVLSGTTVDDQTVILQIGGPGGVPFEFEPDHSYTFKGRVIARDIATGDSAICSLGTTPVPPRHIPLFGVKNVGGVPSQIGTNALDVDFDADLSLATATVSIVINPGPPGTLDITVTGVVGTTIKWVCYLDWVETYEPMA